MPMPVFDDNNKMCYIEIADVISIYKDGKTRKIIVRTENGSYYLPTNIDHINEIMEPHGFHQIDSNTIINITKIKRYDGEQFKGEKFKVVQVNGSKYDVARRRRKGLESKMM